jgi:hypothetical protein
MRPLYQSFLLLSALIISSNLAPATVQAENSSAYYGECFTLHACEGQSIGSFTDDQCQAYGGHSIRSGGICFEL